MTLIENVDYHPGALRYDYVDGCMKHNVSEDYSLFAVWKEAKPFEERIRKQLSRDFEVVLDVEIQWSKRNFYWNACRLYETPVQKTDGRQSKTRGHVAKIGDPSFRLFVVKDNNPYYEYRSSVSGEIAPTNAKVAAAKREFRSWVDAPYRVHSSNNIGEFYSQATLLLGVPQLNDIFNGKLLLNGTIEKDLEGADGWDSWSHVMEVLRWTADYLVLRNFEYSDLGHDGDIDILCSSSQALCSAMAARQLLDRGQPYKGRTHVSGKEVSVDARYCGDGYFDQTWQRAVLSRKIFENGLFHPRDDDYFFSLLYHAAVHKPRIKSAYVSRFQLFGGALQDIVASLNSLDTEVVARVLKGYMETNGYYYEHPIDPKVGKNTSVVRHLPTRGRRPSKLSRKIRKLMRR